MQSVSVVKHVYTREGVGGGVDCDGYCLEPVVYYVMDAPIFRSRSSAEIYPEEWETTEVRASIRGIRATGRGRVSW